MAYMGGRMEKIIDNSMTSMLSINLSVHLRLYIRDMDLSLVQ